MQEVLFQSKLMNKLQLFCFRCNVWPCDQIFRYIIHFKVLLHSINIFSTIAKEKPNPIDLPKGPMITNTLLINRAKL